ncbi:MAG TPA: DNA-directed RNA polymerase subunit omega [Terriglobales bacterium]|nr:DNA-directed RNA polymerase subunit omega [Terriglobales bacterium]
MKLMDGFDSNYRYILVAARRARQLQGGAPPVIETPSRKPCRIAQDEIRAGKVKWLIPELPKAEPEAVSEPLDKAVGEA